MTHYSVQSRDRMFVKDYGFLPFSKKLSKNIGNIISEDLSGKYSQKLLDLTK